MTTSYIYDAPTPYDEAQPYDFLPTWGTNGAAQQVIPHLSASMVLANDGTFQFWQQNTIDEVAQCVEVLCGTTQGDRTVVPGFGLPILPFNTTPTSQIVKIVQQAVNQWEPRANVGVTVVLDSVGNETITVSTSLRQGSTT